MDTNLNQIEKIFIKVADEKYNILKQEYLNNNFKNGIYNLMKEKIDVILKAHFNALLITKCLQKLNKDFPNNIIIKKYLERFDKISYYYDLTSEMILKTFDID